MDDLERSKLMQKIYEDEQMMRSLQQEIEYEEKCGNLEAVATAQRLLDERAAQHDERYDRYNRG